MCLRDGGNSIDTFENAKTQVISNAPSHTPLPDKNGCEQDITTSPMTSFANCSGGEGLSGSPSTYHVDSVQPGEKANHSGTLNKISAYFANCRPSSVHKNGCSNLKLGLGSSPAAACSF